MFGVKGRQGLERIFLGLLRATAIRRASRKWPSRAALEAAAKWQEPLRRVGTALTPPETVNTGPL
jgi:hypothetical protein